MKKLFLLLVLFWFIFPNDSFAASTWQDSFDDGILTESITRLYRTGDSYVLDKDRSAPNAYPVDPTEVFYQDAITNGTTYNGFTFPQDTGTIEIWANGTFANTGEDSIVSNWTGTTEHIFLRTYTLGGTEVNFQVAFENPGQPYAFSASGFVADDEWNFFAITWDVNAGVADVYANGVLVRHGVINDPTWRPSAQVFNLGSGFAGQMSHARVLSKYVDSTQVRSDYGTTLASSGTLFSKPIQPISLSSWGSLSWTATVPINTGYKTQVEYDNNGSWDLLPDGILSGNAVGFASSPVSLAGVSPTTYPKIRLKGNFTTSDGITTAELTAWQVSWTSALNAHPRMYLNPEKIDFLKAKITANEEPYTSHWLAIKASADASLLVTPPAPTDAIVTDPSQQAAFRTIGNRLPALALSYLITDDDTYFNGTKVWMDALVSYDHWQGDESLGAAHGLYNMAIAYDWLYNDLTGGERTAYETKIALQTKRFYDAMNRTSPVWWQGTDYNGNHNYVDVGAMMTGAVALYDVTPGADTYVHRAYDNFTTVLSGPNLIPDGTSQEGISYWSYGMEALLRYFELEKDMFGIDRALTSPNIQNLPFYRLYGGMPNYWQTITMGDGRNWDYYGAGFILMRVASLFNDQMAQWLAQKINDKRVSSGIVGIDNDWRSLLWYDESVGKQDISAMPTYKLFPYLGLFTSRSSWTDDNAFMFAMKAGPPGGHDMTTAGGHVHPDEGGFTLRDFGQDIIVDDEYSYNKLTSNHNVPTFDGGSGQLGEGSVWFDTQSVIDNYGTADIIYTDFDDTKGYEYLVADLASIYKPSLSITKFLRHFILLKKGTLVIVDEIESGSDHQIEWRLHLNHNSTFEMNAQTLSGTIDGTGVGLVVDDISEEAHSYSIGKETITASGDGTTSTFNANTFQLSKTGHSWKIETVLRPFQTTAPSAIEYSRKGGYLVIKLSDHSYSAISTDLRLVRMDVDPNNIDGLPVVISTSRQEKPKPSVHDSPNSAMRGEIITQSGKNFPRRRVLSLYFSRPDGSYYPPVSVKTDAKGSFKIRYKVTKPPGKYKWYARDTVSGRKTKVTRYTVK